MRTFLGFPCSDELVDELRTAQQALPESSAIKWVKPENFHLTLKFLGDRSGTELEDLDRAFLRKLPTVGPLNLSVRGLGAFPDPGNPSVLWAGVEQPDALGELEGAVEAMSVTHGADPEDRDYHAHVTLARVKGNLNDTTEVVRWVQEHGDRAFGEIEADHLVLYESELREDGPVYHERKRWPL